jgi:hypothetical protein
VYIFGSNGKEHIYRYAVYGKEVDMWYEVLKMSDSPVMQLFKENDLVKVCAPMVRYSK